MVYYQTAKHGCLAPKPPNENHHEERNSQNEKLINSRRNKQNGPDKPHNKSLKRTGISSGASQVQGRVRLGQALNFNIPLFRFPLNVVSVGKSKVASVSLERAL